MTRSLELPEAVCALLDGTRLDVKVGTVVQLAVSDDAGWPRVAAISVGELFAVSATRLLLTLLSLIHI